MNMRNFEQCRLMTKSPSWSVIDVVRWKVVPERLGGGRRYARGFKNAWVKKHSSHIRLESLPYKPPPEFAMHLRQLADYDKLPVKLGMNDVKIIGARYNRGANPSMESLKKDMSYGEFIVKNWEHFHRLVW